MVYKRINHATLVEHEKYLETTSRRQVVYEFYKCSTNIPSGLSAYNHLETCGLLLLYNNSEDARFFRGFTGTITHSWLTNQSARIDLVII